MLRLLRIRNLAVIEAVEVEFEPGFNVLTGETGAGKSIVVEAVGLLLGARASADLVRTGESQATIEALFEDDRDGVEVLIRREVSSSGRSRSFVNGDLATATVLRDLAQRLVEIHGQHEHQTLLDPLSHLPLLDGYAELGSVAERVTVSWRGLRQLRDQLERSRMDGREKAARLELIGSREGEPSKVLFAGWVPQAECAGKLRSQHCLVLPSLMECGGAVVLEAMALGLPVIATAWGGPADYLDPGCGILVAPTSRDALVGGLADAMTRLARDPALRASMGHAGRQKVLREFDWEAKVDRMLEVYRDAAETHRPNTSDALGYSRAR